MIKIASIQDANGVYSPAEPWPDVSFGCVIKDGFYHFAETQEEADVLLFESTSEQEKNTATAENEFLNDGPPKSEAG